MTVSTLPAIAAPETSADAAPGAAMIPIRDAADAAGVAAVFPSLLQLLQQRADPVPSQAEPAALLSLDIELVRGLLPAANGAAVSEADASGRPESGDEADATGTETVLAWLPIPHALAIAPAVLAALPAPALGERPTPPTEAPRLPEPVGAPTPWSSAPPPGSAEVLRPNVAGADALPSGVFALPETTPPAVAGAGVTPAGIDEWHGRPQSMTAGNDPTPLRAESRPAGLGPVAAGRRDETRSDAGGDDASRDGDPRTAEPSTRVDRPMGSAVGLDAQLRATAEMTDPPASREPTAARPLVEQVVTRLTPLRQGRQEVSLRLEPPDLGSVRVEAVLDGQRLTLRITTEHESARSVLEGTLPRLRESLSQQGFVADQLTVQLGLDASSREFGGRGFGFERPVPSDLPARAPESVSAPARWRQAAADGLDLWA